MGGYSGTLNFAVFAFNEIKKRKSKAGREWVNDMEYVTWQGQTTDKDNILQLQHKFVVHYSWHFKNCRFIQCPDIERSPVELPERFFVIPRSEESYYSFNIFKLKLICKNESNDIGSKFCSQCQRSSQSRWPGRSSSKLVDQVAVDNNTSTTVRAQYQWKCNR